MPRPDSPAAELVRRLTGANEAIGLAFATEAGQFQEIGIDAIVCGPGSIEQAHQPDEFIELSQLAEGEAFLRRRSPGRRLKNTPRSAHSALYRGRGEKGRGTGEGRYLK